MNRTVRPFQLQLAGGIVDIRFRVLLAQEGNFEIFAAPAAVGNGSEYFGDVYLYAVINKGKPYQLATFNQDNELVWWPSFDEVPTEEDEQFLKEYKNTFLALHDMEQEIKNLYNSLIDGKFQAVMA